ncbi:probable anion transporter 2, chloroplastic [Eurytemora carolleeae]|uniref:probable anion transporter 2, chloroplastic n=1 Tax=Eurytemora carolleeae TaxID=1294199 RepID=UPI000C77D3F8|nr:probable anion transporter 2, chloroplastic [Eurytemora carolleeae]|eukprot:XP_023343977.1 probable anion transporter 2, chloroplastic [Eurytemora affinis]
MSGHIQNILSISPNRSGTLYGLTNGFGNISGFLVPMVKDWVVQDLKSVSDWRYLFIIAASLYLFETIYFNIFASRRVQEFNEKDYKEISTIEYVKTSCCTFYCDAKTTEHN